MPILLKCSHEHAEQTRWKRAKVGFRAQYFEQEELHYVQFSTRLNLTNPFQVHMLPYSHCTKFPHLVFSHGPHEYISFQRIEHDTIICFIEIRPCNKVTFCSRPKDTGERENFHWLVTRMRRLLLSYQDSIEQCFPTLARDPFCLGCSQCACLLLISRPCCYHLQWQQTTRLLFSIIM